MERIERNYRMNVPHFMPNKLWTVGADSVEDARAGGLAFKGHHEVAAAAARGEQAKAKEGRQSFHGR